MILFYQYLLLMKRPRKRGILKYNTKEEKIVRPLIKISGVIPRREPFLSVILYL